MSAGYYGYGQGGVGAEFPGELGAEFPGELGQAEALAALPGSPLERRDPRIEDLMLGGDLPWTIPAGETRSFEINPRLVFRGKRLVLLDPNGETVGNLVLESVNVNARDQVVTRDPVPQIVWGANSTHVLGGDVMRPGVGAVFRITNTGDTDTVVYPCLYGEAVRPEVPQELAVALLRASPRADLAMRVRAPYEDLVGASPVIRLESPVLGEVGPAVTVQLNPKLRFRATRIIFVGAPDEAGEQSEVGYWLPDGSAGVIPGVGVLESFQIATLEQVLGGSMDIAAFGSDSTHSVKGTIMDPGNGAYLTVRPQFVGGESPIVRNVRAVVFGRADTAA